MEIQDVKERVIASVTSALAARGIEPPEKRLEQFGEDFIFIMDGIDGHDLFRVTSLLADFSAFLVSQLAEQLEADPSSLMHFLATQMLEMQVAEADPEED